MNCDGFYERITDHQEGVLSTDDCSAIEAHLKHCQECNGLRSDLEALAKLCREAKEKAEMPPAVRARIESLLQQES
jgi:predicted anti-sigma-YlaC factor YlaD